MENFINQKHHLLEHSCKTRILVQHNGKTALYVISVYMCCCPLYIYLIFYMLNWINWIDDTFIWEKGDNFVRFQQMLFGFIFVKKKKIACLWKNYEDDHSKELHLKLSSHLNQQIYIKINKTFIITETWDSIYTGRLVEWKCQLQLVIWNIKKHSV